MKHKKIFSNYWLKHYYDEKTGLCKLCGNTGKVKTNPSSPSGKNLGEYTNYCICPNGRTMRGD